MLWARIAAIAILLMMGMPIIIIWIRFFKRRKKTNDDNSDN